MTSSPQLPSVVRFGAYEADLLSGELRKSGIRLKIQDRPFQILAILLEHPGLVVTREQLQKRMWPEDTFVDFEHGLNTAINKLRDALSDEADNPRFIETLPKRGYRFIAPVSASAAPRAHLHAVAPTNVPTPLPAPGLSAASQSDISSAAPANAPSKSRLTTYLAASALLLLCVALLIAGYFFFRSRGGERAEIRIAPLNGLPRESDASFSPDGDQVAFVWAGEKGNYAHIYVSQIGAADSPRRLTSADDQSFEFAPAWSPDGRYIAFFRFNQKEQSLSVYITASLGGSERRLYTVRSYRKVDALDWSPDGKYLAFCDSDSPGEASKIVLLSLDTLEVRPITTPAAGTLGDLSPAFSPDGKLLAFVRNTLDVMEIYRVPVTGGPAAQITFDHADIQGIAWTPDSKDLVFSSSRQGSPSLWRVSAQGGTPLRLPIAGAGWSMRPAISRKGNRLAYTSVNYSVAIWKGSLSADHKVSGPLERFITSTGIEEGPQFSPDGKHIIFQSSRTGYHEIWRADADGSNTVQLTHFSTNLTGTPRWSPDSRQIAFDSRPGGHSQIFVINSEGGQPRQVTQGDFDSAVPSWSTDGKWIYFASNRSGGWQVWKISPSGNSPAQITQQGGFAALPSLDGKYLYYAKGRDLPGIWRVPASGGEETKMFEGPPVGGWGYYAITSEGIYYPEVAAPAKPGLYFYSFATQTSSLAMLAEHQQPSNGAPALAISPDGRTMLIGFQDQPLVYIMLVENFRP
ncbi:MAG TPA: DPP IV N-terminal domain-containing protein [Candidatus Limnocylindrales bacterium]|nr:DPP IV N-terminal domain-containing protein [Candidatus Limnocylindrales bacterium]